jgi:hypothetical protein
MKQSIRVSIPKPCNEQWNSFKPTPEGGFCASCSKNVIDFTHWDEERIKAFFNARPSNTCGRFRTDQLKTYSLAQKQQRSTGWWSLLFAGVVTLFTSRQAWAQSKTIPATEQRQAATKQGEVVSKPAGKMQVDGIVTYAEDGTPQPGVNVIRKGTAEGTVTNAEGKFSITIENPNPTEVLLVSFIGLQTVEYLLDPTEPVQTITITMQPDITMLGGIVLGGVQTLRWYNPKRWWWRVKRIFN